MASVTVPISEATHKVLLELSSRGGEPIEKVLDKAIEDYRRNQLLDATNAAYEALRGDEAAWQEELEERRVWGVTLESDTTSLGSVAGRLESVSIDGTNRFFLYPPVRGEQIECIFDRGDLSAVARALGQNVTAHGRLEYARSRRFPVRVRVETFEITPPADELPTLLNARGVMHSPLASTELIREARDEWD